MSVRASTGSPRTCSGARYFAVPTIIPGWVRSASGHRLCDAEVGDLDPAVPAEQDVGRLHVSVHEAGAVGRFEGLRDLGGQAGRLPRVDRCRIVDPLPQRAAGDELHHDRLGAVLRARVVDGDDARVGEAGRGHRFEPEPRHEGAVRGEVRVQDLHGHPSAEHLVGALPDLRHATGGEQRLESVPPAEQSAGLDRHRCSTWRAAEPGEVGWASSRTLEPSSELDGRALARAA